MMGEKIEINTLITKHYKSLQKKNREWKKDE